MKLSQESNVFSFREPSQNRVDEAISIQMVEGVLDQPPRSLIFPKLIEKQFENDSGAARCRQLIWRGILSVIVLDLFTLVDYKTIPDVAQLSFQLRFGVLTTYAIFAILVLLRNPLPFYRETLEGVGSVLATAAIMVLTVKTESPIKPHNAYGIILVVMFVTSVQVLRFWYAVVTCTCIVAVYFIFANALDEGVRQQMALVPGLIIGAVVLCLTSSYALERESRISYLNNLLQRLHRIRLEDLSSHDPLTGLGNRRALDSSFDAFKTSGSENLLVSVILIDIDYFKAFNDSYGHLAGDQCLKDVASILRSQCRSDLDAVYRFGGEEFVVLLRNTDVTVTAEVANRMRLAIVQSQIPHCKPTTKSVVTASFGVTSGAVDISLNIKPLLLAADEALYHAKADGRNRVAVYGSHVFREPVAALAS